ERAARYNQLFEPLAGLVQTPYEPSWSRAVYHLYVVRVPERDELIRHLSERQIGSGIHYPVPLHLQQAYAPLGYRRGDFPVSETVCAQVVSLPLYPQIRMDQQQTVAREVARLVTAKASTARP
ncbi:MAG TPA: DegT/DnrJ/EryC1/StrS family aminotransferase, partial [Terriglobia bacterium]|nr:DegT/DnrJ/EryC1/StrS family aminotransferase [Terriglobia bacterium]